MSKDWMYQLLQLAAKPNCTKGEKKEEVGIGDGGEEIEMEQQNSLLFLFFPNIVILF